VVHTIRVEAWKGWLREKLHTGDDIPTIWIKGMVDGKSVQPSRLAKILSVGLFSALLIVLVLWLCALLYTPIVHPH
jgi:hypothetical protein